MYPGDSMGLLRSSRYRRRKGKVVKAIQHSFMSKLFRGSSCRKMRNVGIPVCKMANGVDSMTGWTYLLRKDVPELHNEKTCTV